MDFFNLPTEVKERTSKGLDLQGNIFAIKETFSIKKALLHKVHS